MSIAVFRQGDDAKIEFDVPSPHEGLFEQAEDAVASLIVDGETQYKYTIDSKRRSGYGKFKYDENATPPKITVFVERQHSIDFKVGTLSLYMVYKRPDSSFDDGNITESFKLNVGKVMEGRMLDESI